MLLHTVTDSAVLPYAVPYPPSSLYTVPEHGRRCPFSLCAFAGLAGLAGLASRFSPVSLVTSLVALHLLLPDPDSSVFPPLVPATGSRHWFPSPVTILVLDSLLVLAFILL